MLQKATAVTPYLNGSATAAVPPSICGGKDAASTAVPVPFHLRQEPRNGGGNDEAPLIGGAVCSVRRVIGGSPRWENSKRSTLPSVASTATVMTTAAAEPNACIRSRVDEHHADGNYNDSTYTFSDVGDSGADLAANYGGCRHRTASSSNSSSLRGHWKPWEDAKLKDLVAAFGPQNWNLIAENLPARSGKSCRLRWFNQLDPRINRRPFSGVEEEALLAAHSLYGNKWALIARLFPGRTDNAVKNQWHVLSARRHRHRGGGATTTTTTTTTATKADHDHVDGGAAPARLNFASSPNIFRRPDDLPMAATSSLDLSTPPSSSSCSRFLFSTNTSTRSSSNVIMNHFPPSISESRSFEFPPSTTHSHLRSSSFSHNFSSSWLTSASVKPRPPATFCAAEPSSTLTISAHGSSSSTAAGKFNADDHGRRCCTATIAALNRQPQSRSINMIRFGGGAVELEVKNSDSSCCSRTSGVHSSDSGEVLGTGGDPTATAHKPVFIDFLGIGGQR